MLNRPLVLYYISANLLIFVGCSSDDSDKNQRDTGNYPNIDASTDSVVGFDSSKGVTKVDGGISSDINREASGMNSDNDDDSGEDFKVCETYTAELEKVASRVTILLDKSQSMSEDNKWNLALNAINSIVSEFDEKIAFGFDAFSRNTDLIGSLFRRNSTMCDVGDQVVLDVSMESGDRILRTLRTYRPGDATPLQLAMMNYSDPQYAPIFMNQKGKSYLVIISDGIDTCGATGEFDENGGATAGELAQVAEKLYEDSGIYTVVIGFGEGADPEQLNAIADAGGTEFTEYFDASNGDELTDALNTIAKAVSVSCQFQIGQTDENEVNLDLVNVFLDEVPVPRDDGCEKDTGWTWTNSERTTIEFCDAACDRVKANEVDNFSVEIACNVSDVIII